MSLLNVTVKRAKYIGAQAAHLNTYVTLKLQNVKSTTVTVKGQEPCWEQDFLFETNNVNSGLLIEIWTKGMIWDRALGYQLIALDTIPYNIVSDEPMDAKEDCISPSEAAQHQQLQPYQQQNGHKQQHLGRWYPIDMEIILMNGEVTSTKNPTGHMILLDCRFELPFDPDIHPGDLQRKLELLNGIMTHDRRHRHAQYLGTSGYSEDSDYTSDLNYPVGQNANSSASQYRNLRTPSQRSLETSRENSYEKDDRRSPFYDCYNRLAIVRDSRDQRNNMTFYSPTDYYYKDENDPLSYNSRPMSRISNGKTLYDNINTTQSIVRKRSLERQDTLYDEYGSCPGDPYTQDANLTLYDGNGSNDGMMTMTTSNNSYNFYVSVTTDNLSEDRQWDSGGRGTSLNQKILPKTPIKHSSSMVDGIHHHRGASLPPTPPVTHKKSRLLPQPVRVTSPTSSTTPAKSRLLPQPKIGKKIPTPILSRTDTDQSSLDYYDQLLPLSTTQTTAAAATTTFCNNRPLTSVSALNYNEDYNYAYNSSDSLNQDLTTTNTPTGGLTTPTISGKSSTGRRKGAALPTVPKIGISYNSQSFDNDFTSTSNEFYSDSTTTDDYFYESNQSGSKKNKKLPIISSSSSTFSSKYGSVGSGKLPAIPFAASTTIQQQTGLNKMAATTPLAQTSYDNFYGSSSDYGETDFSYLTTATPTTTTTTSKTLPTPTSYFKASTSASTGQSIGSSVLGTLATGFKSTVGAVGGSSITTSNATTTSSTTTSSLTSTAKSYLGLASKFLPNLAGSSSTTITTTTTTTTTTSTTKASTMSSTTKSTTASSYSDYYYNNNSSSAYTYGSTEISSSIYDPKIAVSTTPTMKNDSHNSYPYYNSTNIVRNENDSDQTTSYYGSFISQERHGDGDANYLPTGEVTDSYYGYEKTLVGSTTVSTTTIAVTDAQQSSSIGNIADYTNYKYGYDDDYTYSENYYIATGDITDRKSYNYNNNYDTYDDILMKSTTAAASDSTAVVDETIKSSSLNHQDYDCVGGSRYVNKNSNYCDNSFTSNGMPVSTTLVSPLVAATSTIASTNFPSNKINLNNSYTSELQQSPIAAAKTTSIPAVSPTIQTNSSTIPATTGLNYYTMDQQQSSSVSVIPSFTNTTTASTIAPTTIQTSNTNHNNNIVTTTVATAATINNTAAAKLNGKTSSLLLMKQQPTEIYEEDDDVYAVDHDHDNVTVVGEASNSYYATSTTTTTASTTIPQYGTVNDTPYYDYRDDYFNEEDEYKYLEKEQEQQQQQQQELQQQFHQFHKKQPPLEYIEESHDDYIDDDLNDNKATVIATPTITTTSTILHQHKLTVQDSINEESIQQQHLALKKQDSVRELENEESSPGEFYSYDSKDTGISKALLQPQQPSSLLPTSGISTTAGGVGIGIGGGVSIAGIIVDVENDINFKKKASLTRGETEEVSSGQLMGVRKPEITARQRWNWAYNKIIMQLNVSRTLFILPISRDSNPCRVAQMQ